MSEKSLAFAVAKIRSFENSLLLRNHYEQLLSLENTSDVFDLLAAHRYEIGENAKTLQDVLDFSRENDYLLLKDLAGDRKEIKVFTIKNDYHNLKTAIKAYYGSVSGDDNMLSPAEVSIDTIKEAVSEKKYDLLPGFMAEAAAEAYDVLVTSGDGQMADVIIDKYTLKEFENLALQTDSEMIKEYCLATIAAGDIKTAVRGAKTGKGDDFFEKALCGSADLDKTGLTRAARKGEEEVISFIGSAGYTEAAAALKNSVYEFEKWYDGRVLKIMQEALFINFDIEPLIAYGFKRENEIKNIRIAATCKSMGVAQTAMERMCLSDV